MRSTWWKSGSWSALCDQCGFKRKSNELTQRWDGAMVCLVTIKPGCWELQQPQELIRPIPDMQPIPWTRPEPIDQFIPNDFITATMGCTLDGQSAYPELAVPGCSIPGNMYPAPLTNSQTDIDFVNT